LYPRLPLSTDNAERKQGSCMKAGSVFRARTRFDLLAEERTVIERNVTDTRHSVQWRDLC
jgi:hypothetical protein